MATQSHLGEGALGWVARHDMPDRIPRALIERLEALDDLSSTVSDVLDQLGIVGVVNASVCRPTISTGRVIGTAVTVRNQEQRISPSDNAKSKSWQMAEIAALPDAAPGDVLVIEGVAGVSNMGGLIATMAKRQGVLGAVVDGGVRDVAHSRRMGFPVWSRDISPITGKWRCITREINGPVSMCGVTVEAGDLVVADETGVCFVPAGRAAEVVERCEQIAAFEARLAEEIDGGRDIADIIHELYPASGVITGDRA